MIETVKAAVRPVAKAVAMLVAPFVLVLAGWAVNALGVDLAVPELDQWVTWITTLLVAVINAAITWYVTNRPAG